MAPTNIVPSHAIRVSKKDALKVNFWGMSSGRDLYVRYFIMLDNGEVIPSTEFLSSPADLGSTSTATYPLTDGWLISVSCILDAAESPGAGWAVIELTREETSAREANIALVSGQPSYYRSISWPGVPPVPSIEAQWQPGYDLISDPAAGADLSHQLSGYEMFEIESVRLTLATDATVATRSVTLAFDFGSGVTEVAKVLSNYSQGASLTRTYHFVKGYAYDAVIIGNDVMAFFPGVVLPGNGRIRTEVNNLQAGDQISNAIIAGRRKIWS